MARPGGWRGSRRPAEQDDQDVASVFFRWQRNFYPMIA
jgi:hypothetical protein